MKKKKIRIVSKRVSLLLKDVGSGKFAIPRLQRELVWDGQRAAKLMDSIYKGMPIGNILVWETPKVNKLYLRQSYHVLPPFNDHRQKVWYLIDGQQRISVLHCLNKGEEIKNSKGKKINFKRIVFSLKGGKNDQKFFYRKPVPDNYVSLNQILNSSYKNYVGLKKNQLTAINKCRSNILNYKIIMVFARMNINQVWECFLRINTQGMKLTTADAIFLKAQTLDLRDFVHEVKQHLPEPHRNIEDMPILWAFSALKGGAYPGRNNIESTINKIEKEAVKKQSIKKEISKEWDRLKKCFGNSVVYLKEDFNVLSAEFLYSPYMISMLALFYYHNNQGPDQMQKEEIRKWFWSTTVASRYSGKNFYKCLQADVDFFEKLAKKKNIRFTTTELAHISDVKKVQYDSTSSGLGSAFYCLLFSKGPVSLLENGLNKIPLDNFSTVNT